MNDGVGALARSLSLLYVDPIYLRYPCYRCILYYYSIGQSDHLHKFLVFPHAYTAGVIYLPHYFVKLLETRASNRLDRTATNLLPYQPSRQRSIDSWKYPST